jgi:3-oxoacyl-[acyl-carrier-protein] synthase II
MATRVVVTGMGTINSLGHSVEETWQNLIRGVSGVGAIEAFDTSDMGVKIACEIKNYNPADTINMRKARRMDRFQQIALTALKEAIEQSGLVPDPPMTDRIGVIVSSAVGGLKTIEEGVTVLIQDGPRRLSPFVIPKIMGNGAAGLIAIELGVCGPSYSVTSACASGADAIGQALLLIRAGILDAAIAGGTEATISRLGVGTFDRLGALSRQNDPPYNTPAPFSGDRDGLVMGEGSAILVLESLEHAQARGAVILGELAGYAATADAFHITAPAEDGAGGARAIELALRSANLKAEDVDYINAHGTGTELNDAAETRAIKTALGDAAYKVAISSTKSMTGHMMGATGALEAIFCIKAIQENCIPPTINLNTPDPNCDLDYVPHHARSAEVNVTLSNAFGFGGHNAVLALKAFSG